MASNPTVLYTPEIIDEGACILRDYGLPHIELDGAKTVVFYRYSLDREHNVGDDEEPEAIEDADGSGEAYFTMALGDLYDQEGEGKKIRPELFDAEVNGIPNIEGVWVIEFIGCSIEVAKDFLKAMAETMNTSNRDPTSVLGSRNLSIYSDRNIDFVTGISLRAAFKPKFLTLFVSIPYLGLGTHSGGNGTLSLEQYRVLGLGIRSGNSRVSADTQGQDTNSGDIGGHDSSSDRGVERILVHQTWFFIFDNEKIAIFKPAGKPPDHRAPLFPYQQRTGGFQALINMIANTLTSSETTSLSGFRKTVSEQELNIQKYTKNNEHSKMDEQTTEGIIQERAENNEHSKRDVQTTEHIIQNYPENIEHSRRDEEPSTEELIRQFERSITDISTMINVVQYQIQMLEDLREIFLSPFKGGLGSGLGKPRPHRNAVKIPFILNAKEQMRATVRTIDVIIQERRTFRTGLNTWLKDLRRSRILFQDDKTLEQAKSMEKAIAQQGQTISVFTLITSVFLPLGFLTGYFGMNPPNWEGSIVTTQAQFWAICGPITLVAMCFMSYFLFVPEDSTMKWIRNCTEPVNRVLQSWRGRFWQPRRGDVVMREKPDLEA